MLSPIAKRNIATFYLILLCVQYLPLEGSEVSYIKFAMLSLSPILWLATSPNFSRAVLWGGLYFGTVLFASLFHLESFRGSTLIYLFSFVSTFILFYNLVWLEDVFSLEYFMRLLKTLMLAYAITLILQQIARVVGVGALPIINLVKADPRALLIGNSLSIEQSHAARIFTVLALALLRMYELRWGRDGVTLSAIFRDAPWMVILFVWSMITIGSGTAIVGLALLLLYFVRRRYWFRLIPISVVLCFAIPYVEFEPLQRAYATLEAVMTLDAKQVILADHSAAARVVPLLNTINELDLSDLTTWIGRGVDSSASAEYLSKMQTVGGITDYGLISYIFMLIFLYRCVIDRFWSLESCLFFVLLGAGVGNIAYQWGVLMILCAVRYFKESHNYEEST